jgi:glycosyltransferase involved in cell wall biosynthesis
MRIAYLTTRYPSLSHTFISREVEELRGRGLKIQTFAIWRTGDGELLSPADHQAHASTYALLPPRLWDYARAHFRALFTSPAQYLRNLHQGLRFGTPGLRGRSLPLLWAIEAIVLWDRCKRQGIDHIHVHFGGAPPVVASLAARYGRCARNAGGPQQWSITVHGSAEFFDPRLAVKVEDAAFVVCISNFARSQVMALVNEEHWDKLLLVHCGLDVAALKSQLDGTAQRSLEGEVGRNHRPLKLLTIGRLVSVKGQAVLLQAASELLNRGLDIRLTIVGDGPEKRKLVEGARLLGLSDRVEWTGAVVQDEVLGYFARADIFCLPSFLEGVPTVLMEAMLTETPVIATRITGVPELVEDGVSGLLVAPGRADAFADAIEALATDEAVRLRMGRAGRQKVEMEFDVRRSGSQLAEAFERHLRA